MSLKELTEEHALEISKKVIKGKEKATSKTRLRLLNNIFAAMEDSERTEEKIISYYHFMQRFQTFATMWDTNPDSPNFDPFKNYMQMKNESGWGD